MAECLTVNTQYQKEPKAYNEPFYVPLALLIFTHNLSLLIAVTLAMALLYGYQCQLGHGVSNLLVQN